VAVESEVRANHSHNKKYKKRKNLRHSLPDFPGQLLPCFSGHSLPEF